MSMRMANNAAVRSSDLLSAAANAITAMNNRNPAPQQVFLIFLIFLNLIRVSLVVVIYVISVISNCHGYIPIMRFHLISIIS